MSGRFFDKKVVEAYIADGSEKFKRSNEKAKVSLGGDENEEAEGEEGRRLDKFGSWLEEG